jgi:PST family polysaccharide transporter
MRCPPGVGAGIDSVDGRGPSPGSPSLSRTAARGTGVTLASQAVRALLQFGSVVVLARLLTPRDFGLVAMVTAVIGVADLIRDFGLSSAAIQSEELSDDERTNLFWANLALGAGCTLVVLAATPLIVAGYRQPQLAPIVMTLAWVFLITGANTQFRSDLARRMRFLALSGSDIVAQAVGILVAAALALSGAGLWAIVAQQLSVAVVAFGINVGNVRWWPGLPRRGVSLRRFFRFGGGLLGTQLIAYATKNVDNIALGASWGAAPLGLYSRAYQLLMMPLNQINAPMTNVALPVLARVQHDEETFARYLARAQLVACYVTATVFAVAAGLAQPLVLVLFGVRWQQVAPIFAILALGGIFRAVAQIAYWIFLARGRTAAQLRQDLVLRPVMIVVIMAGLPWGPIGIAAGHSIAFLGYWIATLAYVGRVTGLDVRPLFRNAVRAIALVAAPSGLVAYAVTLTSLAAPAELVLGILAAGAWAGFAAVAMPSVREDLGTVARFARRAVAR